MAFEPMAFEPMTFGPMTMDRLKKRKDYLKVAQGARTPRRGFLLQSLSNGGQEPARFGFTVTKKTGNAVVRNRIRRRLKEAVRQFASADAPAGNDFVLIGRRPALDMAFADLVADVTSALRSAGRGRARALSDRKQSSDRKEIAPASSAE